MHIIILTYISVHSFFPDIQHRIELIQDFEMPTVCTSIQVSRDGQFILAAGKMSCGQCYSKPSLKVRLTLSEQASKNVLVVSSFF